MFLGLPTFAGGKDLYDMLVIGESCLFNVGCFFELGGPIHIGDRAGLAHEVMVLTTTHKIGRAARRAGFEYAEPVRIGEGVWVGSRATIFPGVTIGQGAVIGAGALVTKDVPANSVVAGVPARVIRYLSDEEVSGNGADAAVSIRARQLG
jgi:maltose O-acetyltransferase